MSICQYITKTGKKCKNKTIPDSKWCHYKKHYPSSDLYTSIMSNIKNKWIDTTFNINLFNRKNVPEDGWCFFHSFGNSILNIYKNKIKHTDPIFSFFNQKKFKLYFENKISKEEFDLEMAKSLHRIASNWILDNLEEKHEFTNELISDILLESHNLKSIEEYKNEIKNMYTIKGGLNRNNWGSLCEQYALSKYFNVNIYVFSPTIMSSYKENFKTKISKTIRKNYTRYLPMNFCQSIGNMDDINNFLRMIDSDVYCDRLEKCRLFWLMMDDECKKDIEETIERTVFLTLIIRVDKDGDDISHYNSLLLDNNLFIKK
jgi:hypothetical protein